MNGKRAKFLRKAAKIVTEASQGEMDSVYNRKVHPTKIRVVTDPKNPLKMTPEKYNPITISLGNCFRRNYQNMKKYWKSNSGDLSRRAEASPNVL